MRAIYRSLGLVTLGLALLVALAVPVQAQGTGILEGQVVNGTEGGSQVGAGIAVTLHVLQGEAEVETQETTTGAEGRFRFEGLDTDPDLAYWLEAVYLDVQYSSTEGYRFDEDQSTLEATVSVYETTPDDSTVTLSLVHIIAQSFDQVLRVSEFHVLGNTGDRTYVGGGGEEEGATTVFIPLPEGAVGLAFEGEGAQERFIEVPGGVMDTEPVPPGRQTSLVVFSYHLVVTGDTIPLERRFAYPVANLNALVAQPGLTLRSDQLQSMGPQQVEGQEYESYLGAGLAPDTLLLLELLPVPDAGSMLGSQGSSASGGTGAPTRGNQELLRWLGFFLAGLAVIGVVVYSLTAKRPRVLPARASRLATDPETRQLLVDLADLEVAFESGQVDEATYHRQRAEKYEALRLRQP